jgi:hypothetical protein
LDVLIWARRGALSSICSPVEIQFTFENLDLYLVPRIRQWTNSFSNLNKRECYFSASMQWKNRSLSFIIKIHKITVLCHIRAWSFSLTFPNVIQNNLKIYKHEYSRIKYS